MILDYFEIRPCTEGRSYTGAVAEAEPVFWTLYLRDQKGFATAIGDFETFQVAYQILKAILLPIRQALDELPNEYLRGPAICHLEDICQQSSNEDRL